MNYYSLIFFTVIGLGLVSALDLGLGYQCTPNIPTKQTNVNERRTVVIIGAGVAGTNAAMVLEKNNVTDWIILEYQSRVGGRTRTVKVGNDPVETCAMWVQGRAEHNPIMKLAKEINLKGGNSKWDYFAYPNIGGGNIPQATVNDVVNKRWYDAYLCVGNKIVPAIECGQIPDMSLSDSYALCGWKARTPFEFAVEESFTNSEWGETMARTSTLNSGTWSAYSFYGEDQAPQGQNPGTPNFVTDPRGIQAIIHWNVNKTLVCSDNNGPCLGNCSKPCGIADPRIRLNSEVKVLNTQTNVITLASGQKIQADYIISTIPLGVLQHSFSTGTGLIQPTWSRERILNLNRYHMINYKKIVIKFTYQFWPNDYHFVLPTTDTLFAINMWTNYNMPEYLPGSNMILGILNSYASDMAETMSPEDYLTLVLKQLNAVFPGAAVRGNVADYFVTNNINTPWLRGAFSNRGPDLTPEIFRNLWQPEDGCHVFWSGEAPCDYLNGYVVGGYWMGAASANSVLKAMGKYSGLPYAENDCFRVPSYNEPVFDNPTCPVVY